MPATLLFPLPAAFVLGYGLAVALGAVWLIGTRISLDRILITLLVGVFIFYLYGAFLGYVGDTFGLYRSREGIGGFISAGLEELVKVAIAIIAGKLIFKAELKNLLAYFLLAGLAYAAIENYAYIHMAETANRLFGNEDIYEFVSNSALSRQLAPYMHMVTAGIVGLSLVVYPKVSIAAKFVAGLFLATCIHTISNLLAEGRLNFVIYSLEMMALMLLLVILSKKLGNSDQLVKLQASLLLILFLLIQLPFFFTSPVF